jgi:predicted nucleic acid-binding protein
MQVYVSFALMIGDFDLLIAATCVRHDLRLDTNNR